MLVSCLFPVNMFILCVCGKKEKKPPSGRMGGKMKNFLKNRVVLGLACIVVSLVVCFGLTPLFNDAVAATKTIVRVNTEIKQGEQITARMVTTVEVGGYNLPANVLCEMGDVVGKYAAADFSKGDYILAGKVSDTPPSKNAYFGKLDGTNRALSVTIQSFAAGLSGKLGQGDVISLIANNVGELRETVILPELQYIEVLATTISDGTDSNEQEGEKEELPSTVTVLVAPEQARLLVELEQGGNLHAALVCQGGDKNATYFIKEQARILEELYPEELLGEDDEDVEQENNKDGETGENLKGRGEEEN